MSDPRGYWYDWLLAPPVFLVVVLVHLYGWLDKKLREAGV